MRRAKMKALRPGDCVVCDCEARTWYRGKPGIVVSINFMGDPRVLYPDGSMIEHARSVLRIAGRAA